MHSSHLEGKGTTQNRGDSTSCPFTIDMKFASALLVSQQLRPEWDFDRHWDACQLGHTMWANMRPIPQNYAVCTTILTVDGSLLSPLHDPDLQQTTRFFMKVCFAKPAIPKGPSEPSLGKEEGLPHSDIEGPRCLVPCLHGEHELIQPPELPQA